MDQVRRSTCVLAQIRAGAQPGQYLAGAGVLQHPVHHRRRHAGRLEQIAQGLAGFHPQDLPAVAGRLAAAGGGKRRQRQCQRRVRGRQQRLDGIGETGDDGRRQRADGREQAGVDPVPARPWLVERGGEVLLQLPVQGGVVQDMQSFLKALLARMAVIGMWHRAVLWSARIAGPNASNIDT